MNLDLEREFSKTEILKDIDVLKKQINAMRPLSGDVENRVMQKLRLEWNYNSNAIEGNKLDYGETVAFLMTGITAKGKPLKDYLDIRGHNEAILFLTSIVKDNRPISEADIRALHEMILVEPYEIKAQTIEGLETRKIIELGKYKSLPNHVLTATGEVHYYATPEETQLKMTELIDWYRKVSSFANIHPVIVAALFHYKFVAIHPFDDGNGRLSRILMNLILMINDYPPAIIRADDKQNYYALLSRADVGDTWPFVEYIIERLRSSLELYLKAANGGDIDEDEDIDKEIALFKMELNNKVNLKEKKSIKKIKQIIQNDIIQVFTNISNKTNEFKDFFFSGVNFLHIEYTNNSGEIKEKNHIFYNAPIDLGNEINQIDTIKDMYFYCDLSEFKNESAFNIKIIWSIVFKEYNYVIIDENQKEILSKYYHENILKKEQQNMIKFFIEELKLKIQAKL